MDTTATRPAAPSPCLLRSTPPAQHYCLSPDPSERSDTRFKRLGSRGIHRHEAGAVRGFARALGAEDVAAFVELAVGPKCSRVGDGADGVDGGKGDAAGGGGTEVEGGGR